MRKVMIKRICLAAFVFVLGWGASVEYLSWRYDYNFGPGSDGNVTALTQEVFKAQCRSETHAFQRDDINSNASTAAYFACLTAHSNALMRKLSFAVTGYNYLSCTQKAESEGQAGTECKKTLDGQMLMLEAQKALPAK